MVKVVYNEARILPVKIMKSNEIPSVSKSVQRVSIHADEAEQRLDNYLLRALKGVPKSHIYRLCRTGQVRVNGGRVKPSYRIQPEDEIRIPPVRMAPAKTPVVNSRLAANLGDSIIYEDDYLLVINKPSGIAVHGGSGISLGVIEALRLLRPECRHLELIHRIDRETSGLLLIAKTRAVLRQAHALLRENKVEKQYLAVVKGHWPRQLTHIEAALQKNILSSGERMVRVSTQGKPAMTEIVSVEHFASTSLLTIKLHTGRTHQIRVHAQHVGYPIVGDEKYGDKEFNAWYRGIGGHRLFLHAHSITVPLDYYETPLHITAPLDKEMTTLFSLL